MIESLAILISSPHKCLKSSTKLKFFSFLFGAYTLALNRCDIYVKNVLDDSSDQSLINLAAQAEAGPSEVSLPITAVHTLCLTPPTPTLSFQC